MILTHKDKDGRVIAWIEYRVVNKYSEECPVSNNPHHYTYAWINDVWIHERLRSKNRFNILLRRFAKMGLELHPWLEKVYWNRGKYNRRMSCYDIRRLVNEPLQKVQ